MEKIKLFDGKALITEALTNEGKIAECYNNFHNYSILNTLALMSQCARRGLEITPVASFKKWSSMGGKIKKGSKALAVNLPLMKKIKRKDEEGNEVEGQILTGYLWRNCVFALSQIEGIEKMEMPKIKGWDYKQAAEKLNIPLIKYDMIDGNCQGYATKDGVAVNPLAEHATRTICHEFAHFMMHFKDKAKELSRTVKEAEAEMVSYLVGAILGLDGADESRGYIQHWLGSTEFSEKSCMRALAVANKILKAGEVL